MSITSSSIGLSALFIILWSSFSSLKKSCCNFTLEILSSAVQLHSVKSRQCPGIKMKSFLSFVVIILFFNMVLVFFWTNLLRIWTPNSSMKYVNETVAYFFKALRSKTLQVSEITRDFRHSVLFVWVQLWTY